MLKANSAFHLALVNAKELDNMEPGAHIDYIHNQRVSNRMTIFGLDDETSNLKSFSDVSMKTYQSSINRPNNEYRLCLVKDNSKQMRFNHANEY